MLRHTNLFPRSNYSFRLGSRQINHGKSLASLGRQQSPFRLVLNQIKCVLEANRSSLAQVSSTLPPKVCRLWSRGSLQPSESCSLCDVRLNSSYKSVDWIRFSNQRLCERRSWSEYHIQNVRQFSSASGNAGDEVESWKDVNRDSPSPSKEKIPRTLDQVIYRIQVDMKRKRKIHKAEIHNAIELIEKASKVDDFGPFFINCCCDILPDLAPEYRVLLVKRIWAVIQKSKEYSVDTFEAMLRTLTLNEDKTTDPVQYLEEAKAAQVGVTPSMYFFALLLACQRGDIETMLKFLGNMKENDVPVNEKVFNALILGNGRRGDLDSAEEIIDLMRASQIEPSSQTWTVLLQIYIEMGKIDRMKSAFRNVSGHHQLSEAQFYELLKAAGRQSNPNVLDQVIDWALTSRKLHYLSIKKLSIVLMYLGHVENALKIILRFSKILQSERDEFLGAFFIKELHFIVPDPQTYVNLVISLQDEKRNPYALNMAAESCLKHKKHELLYKIYEGMIVMNIPIRPHYFYAPFVSEVEENDISGAVKVLKEMKALNVSPDWEMLVNWIVPILFEKKKDMYETLRIIQDAGKISYSSGLFSAGLVVALQQGLIPEAVALAERLKSKVSNPEDVTQALMKCISEEGTKSSSSISKILKYISENAQSDENRDFAGVCILRLIEAGRIKEGEALLQSLAELGVPLSSMVFESISQKVRIEGNIKIDYNLERFNGNGRRILNPSEMNANALESHAQELEAKELNARGTYRKLFLKHCQQGDIAKALEIKNKFKAEFGDLSPGMKSALMGAYIKNDLLDPALEIFHFLSAKNNKDGTECVDIDTYKIIDLATLMTTKGMLKDALKLIKTECPKRSNHRPDTMSRNVVRFLESVSHASSSTTNGKNEDESMVYNLTEFFLKLGIIKPVNPSLGPVIKDLIRRGELTKAVERLEEYSMKFRAAPALQELTYKVLKDQELLERVVKCSISVKGLREGKRLLAIAKSDMGDIDGAAVTFLELGNQLSFISLIRQCEYYASKKQFDKIINLINALYKTGRGYNCTPLYDIAIKACERFGDSESLSTIFSSMQEHDLHIPQCVKKMLKIKDLA